MFKVIEEAAAAVDEMFNIALQHSGSAFPLYPSRVFLANEVIFQCYREMRVAKIAKMRTRGQQPKRMMMKKAVALRSLL